jgi:hypothetical protein
MSYLYPFFDVDELNRVWAREKIDELMERVNEKAPSDAEGIDERVVIVVTPV